MRIKEFTITGYGPLIETGKIQLESFNLFFGNNENGKTLTIDALIKLLLGKKVKDFEQVDRVSGDPRGYLTISLNGSNEIILPDEGNLNEITTSMHIPLTSFDCRNIFIIRNSELSIANESSFYTSMTERLVGLRTTDIKKIRKSLMEIGRLTDGMDFKNDEKTLKLKNRLNRAILLSEKIEELKKHLLEKEFDKLEIDAYKKNNELLKIEADLLEYENARDRHKYEKSIKLFNSLENRISELKDMEIIKEENLQSWLDCEREIKRGEKEISELTNKIDNANKDISILNEKLKGHNNNLNAMDKTKSLLDNERIKIDAIKDGFNKILSEKPLKRLLAKISLLSSIISIIFLVPALFIYHSTNLFIPGVIALLITITLWIIEIIMAIKERKIKKQFESIRLNLAELDIHADTIEEIVSGIRKFYDEYEIIKRKPGEDESLLLATKKNLNEMELKLSELKNIIDIEGKKIILIKTKSSIQCLDEYRNILTIKRDKQKERDGFSSKLEGLLDVHGNSLGEKINLMKSKIVELEQFRDKGTGVEYNQNRHYELKQIKIICENKRKDLIDKMFYAMKQMSEIERLANEIIISNSERLYCKTLVDLEEITKRLNEFIDKNNNRREKIQHTINILDQIEREEKEKVLELFDHDSPTSVSNTFKMITDGLYNEVIYDRDEEKVKVKRKNGDIIDAAKLSGGAYDQLYLSIRLALGEKLLKAEKGFFILDDPFIKSDIGRIKRQINTLKKITEMGWQILYFSAKNEIKEILSDDIKNNKINYVEIKWLNQAVAI